MKSMKVLTVASNFPDQYYQTIAPWSKLQVDAIYRYTDVDVEVIVPRPFTIPLSIVPYYKFAYLPTKTISDTGYTLHYPRFLYLIPKKMFFGATGEMYSYFMNKYIFKNIKKPDLLHARFTYLDGYGLLKICKKWNIPLVIDIHGSEEFGEFVKPIV